MKTTIRKQILSLRKQMSDAEVNEKSIQICKNIAPFLKGTVALYESYGTEVNVATLKACCEHYALPKVDCDTTTIQFYYCNEETQFEVSNFGIQEPKDGKMCEPEKFDVIIVPLVAFDAERNRLGHGKGYYDRFLAQTKALRIGVGYELQKVAQVPKDTWDVPLDIIISEQHIYQ